MNVSLFMNAQQNFI